MMSKNSLAKSATATKADLNRLMLYHDRQFVELAYQIILGRPADESGLAHHVENLRVGESRREIIYRLAHSDEARAKGFDRSILDGYRRWRRIEKIPVVGAIALLLICIARVRFLVREFRRVQNSAYGGTLNGLRR